MTARKRIFPSSNIFEGIQMVISQYYKGKKRVEIKSAIESNGGHVITRPAAGASFLVQAWADDPCDNRLEDCCNLGIVAVPFDYLLTCIHQMEMIPFQNWAQTHSCGSINPSYFLDPITSPSVYYTPVPEAVIALGPATKHTCLLGSAEKRTMDARCREHEEINQSVFEHSKQTWPPLGKDRREFIYILPFLSGPIGRPKNPTAGSAANTHGFPSHLTSDTHLITSCARFVSTYFGCEVRVLPPLSLPIISAELAAVDSFIVRVCTSSALGPSAAPKKMPKKLTKENQYHSAPVNIVTPTTTHLLNVLDLLDVVDSYLPADGYMILGITDQYIYEWPDQSEDDSHSRPSSDDECLNGLLRGRAFGGSRIAVFSTACYGQTLTTARRQSRRQAAKHFAYQLSTMAHEAMHCFGLDHCGLYTCCMNSWCDELCEFAHEPRNKPIAFKRNSVIGCLHVCPICVRKLQLTCGFDVEDRYRQLQKMYSSLGLEEQALWCAAVLRVGSIIFGESTTDCTADLSSNKSEYTA